MSVLDRDEAREALRFLLPDGDAMEVLLDRLEECSRPFVWQDLEDLLAEHYPEDIFPVRADDPSVDPGPRILSLARLLSRAEGKIARIAAFCDEREQASRDDLSHMFNGEPFPAVLLSAEIRALLNGDDA